MATYQSKYTGLEIDQAVELALSGALDSAIPTEVSTEADMIALLESGEVGGVYKYVGTTGTYENGVLYILETDAVTEDVLAGTWVLNDAITISISSEIYNQNITMTFKSNNVEYSSIRVTSMAGTPNLYYGTTKVYKGYEGAVGEWVDTAYKTIDITSKLSEVTNGDILLAWLNENATKQSSEVALGTFTLQYTGGDTSSTTCEFEIGMTWAEWIDSEYSNIGGDVPYLNSSNAVYRVGGNDRDQVKIDGVACYGDDLLINGGLYTSYYDDIYAGGSGN